MTLEQYIKDNGIVLIDANVYRELRNSLRTDVRKRYCSLRDAKHILGFSCNKTFYNHLKDPDCVIRKGKHGKYSLDSVNQEADRLEGIKRKMKRPAS